MTFAKEFFNGFNTNYTGGEEPLFKKKEKIKKIVIKNENLLYVKKVKAFHCDFCGKHNENLLYVKKVKAFHCDFCGEHEVEAFESEFSGSEKSNNNDEMQICYECIKQLFKLTK